MSINLQVLSKKERHDLAEWAIKIGMFNLAKAVIDSIRVQADHSPGGPPRGKSRRLVFS